MQRLTLILAGAALALAVCSCGGTGLKPGSDATRLSAELTPEYSINAATAALVLTAEDGAQVLSATGLADTKALYGRVHYDPASQHFAGSTALQGDGLLMLFYDRPAQGYVEFGAVVPNFAEQPGLSGSLQLASLRFVPGAASANRVASKAPFASPIDDITLTGTIDAANIPTLTWKEQISADGNNDGTVTLNDLTQIGQSFHKHPDPTAPADKQARDADYDENGEVNVNDLSQLGKSMGNSLGGYWIKTSSTPTGFTDLEQLPRTTEFPVAPKFADGDISWTWTGAALTADTYFQVEPYDATAAEARGLPSHNDVLLQPTLTVVYTNLQLSFVGEATWPANRIAPNGDYMVIATENSVDATDGNAEPFAKESMQLVVTAENVNNPGVPIDITNTAFMGLSEGGGLANVSLVSATRGKLTFKDRGRITIQSFAPGDFTVNDTISFDILTIDSMTMTSTAGANPVSVAKGTAVPFKVSGKFDFDSVANSNEILVDITKYCNWGVLAAPGNTGTPNMRSDIGELETATLNAGDSVQVVAEFPNTDDVTLFDNQKRSTVPFVVNIT